MALKIVYPVCCGIDVHKTFVVACIASNASGDRPLLGGIGKPGGVPVPTRAFQRTREISLWSFGGLDYYPRSCNTD
jgi:hypothetical protein